MKSYQPQKTHNNTSRAVNGNKGIAWPSVPIFQKAADEKGKHTDIKNVRAKPPAATNVVQRVISIGIDEDAVEYGPEKENKLINLIQYITTEGITLDEYQKAKLKGLYDDVETHTYDDLNELFKANFNQVIKLGPVTENGNKKTACDKYQQVWHVSNSTKPEDFDAAHFQEELTDKFLIQCAVAGGEMYKMLLSGYQPDMRYWEKDGLPYRASASVPGYKDWPSVSYNDEDASTSEGESAPLIVKDKKVYGNAKGEAKPIVGLLSVFTTALFLGDLDLNAGNIGLVEKGSSFSAVKIDPECSFGIPFFSQNEEDIKPILNDPAKKWKKGEFMHDFGESVRQALNDEEELVQSLLTSAEASKEKWLTIDQIIGTPPEMFDEIIDQCITDEFATQKVALKSSFRRRLEIFEAAAKDLRSSTTNNTSTNKQEQ